MANVLTNNISVPRIPRNKRIYPGEGGGTIIRQIAPIENKTQIDLAIQDTGGLTGFVDKDNIVVSYNYTNRTITLTGDLTYYFRGVKYELTSPWTSDAHAATVGKWFLYTVNGIDFLWANSSWDFSDIMLSMVNYKATEAATFAIRECHGTMDRDSHEELHQVQGTYLDPVNGGGKATAGTYTLNTVSDAATTPGFDQAVVKDEDLRTTIPAWIQGTYTTMYINSSSEAVFNISASFPFVASGSFLQVNNPLTGAMTDGINNRYYNVYQVLIPVTSDAPSQKYRMIMLQPQKEYTSQATAEAEDANSLLFGDLTNLTAEFKVYSRLCYQTASGDSNTGKCRLMSITYVVGTKSNPLNVGGVIPTNHANLFNLDWTNTGHTGTANKYAGFDSDGLPIYLDGGGGGGSYLDLTDTSDTTYAAKDKYVPMVNEANEELDLTPTEIATFFSLSDFDETTYSGKELYILQVNAAGTKIKLIPISDLNSLTQQYQEGLI